MKSWRDVRRYHGQRINTRQPHIPQSIASQVRSILTRLTVSIVYLGISARTEAG